VSTTPKELKSTAGTAVAGGGTRLLMSDVIRMACHARHYLAIFGDGKALAMYHTQLLAALLDRQPGRTQEFRKLSALTYGPTANERTDVTRRTVYPDGGSRFMKRLIAGLATTALVSSGLGWAGLELVAGTAQAGAFHWCPGDPPPNAVKPGGGYIPVNPD
jgi:Domain of unknown function (DUF222)